MLKAKVVRVRLDGESVEAQGTIVARASAMRYMLEGVACRLYGKRDYDWRMVQDSTVIGFHVRATERSGCDGEVLELR